MSRRTRVGIVFGGRSVEHEVSLISARSVMAAIDPERFEAVPIGVTKEGRWLIGGDPMRELTRAAEATRGRAAAVRGESPSDDPPVGIRPMLPGLSEGGRQPARAGSAPDSEPLDVIFPLVHGISGEDGTLQGLLEMADLPYVGAGVLGSSVGMDKDVSRRLFVHQGLPAVETICLRRSEWEGADRPAIARRVHEVVGWPCFVKPAGSGSSVGVSKVRTESELAAALDLAFQYDLKALVERAVNAREIEVAVLGNVEPVASVPGEIVPAHEFYDYESKYLTESKLLVPAPLEPAQAAEARRLAIEAFRVLDLAGMARVDLFLDRETGRFYLNEINTLPGFTPVSMYPRLWEATGLPYRELITRLIALALERRAERRALRTSYTPGVPESDPS